MNHDVARYLLLSAQQHNSKQQHQQNVDLTSQLHALRLKCAAEAERSQAPPMDKQLFSDVSEQCSKLLLEAGASGQAADAR